MANKKASEVLGPPRIKIPKKKQKAKRPIRTKSQAQTKPTSDRKGPKQGTERIEERKPEFEKSLQDLAGSHQPEEPKTEEKVESRGGARPGAGRPRGVTDNFAAVNRLPEKANLTLVPVLQIPFKTWAKATGVNKLELDKTDAEKLALPVTQLLEFYFPKRIPEIAWVWLMFTGTVYNILEPRLDLLAEMRKAKVSVPAGSSGPATPSSRPHAGAAEPAKGFPKE